MFSSCFMVYVCKTTCCQAQLQNELEYELVLLIRLMQIAAQLLNIIIQSVPACKYMFKMNAYQDNTAVDTLPWFSG